MVRDTTLALDIARMVQDERVRNDTLRAIEAWFEPDGPCDVARDAAAQRDDAVLTLHLDVFGVDEQIAAQQ